MANDERRLEARLGLFSATTILVGSMIGSGIFVSPSIMAGLLQAPGLLIGLWIFGGIFTILGALSYAELAAMYPKAGGQYVYLREAFGRLWAFLFGWTLFLVIQTGFNAAVSIAFAKYLGVFYPALGEKTVLFKVDLQSHFAFLSGANVPAFVKAYTLNSAQLTACGVIAFLTWVNILGVKQGAAVQNVFTSLKVGALVVLIVMGIYHFGSNVDHFQPVFDTTLGVNAIAKNMTFAAALAVAMSKALFAYDAWNTVTFVAEEVREPKKNLPRALFLGSVVVTVVYVLTNVAYLAAVPIGDMAAIEENRIGQTLATLLFGSVGTKLVVVAILISTFGCVNGLILGGARVCYAMAREGLFFPSCAKLHPVRGTPVAALWLQGIWSCVLTLTGSFDALLTYTTFASVLFAVLTVVGVFVLRAKHPNAERPYRCWGYPVTPILYLAIAVPFLVYVIQGDPVSTGIGMLLVLSGVPAFLIWNRNQPM